jgi:hypothetical protein
VTIAGGAVEVPQADQPRALSSEVDTGSRKENASKQKLDSIRTGL